MSLLTFQRRFQSVSLWGLPFLRISLGWVHGHCGLSPRLCLFFFSLVCPTQTEECYNECATNTKKCESWEGEGFIFIHNDVNVAGDWTLVRVTNGKEKHTALSLVWILFCVSVTKMWKNGSVILSAEGIGYHRVGEVVSLQDHTEEFTSFFLLYVFSGFLLSKWFFQAME